MYLSPNPLRIDASAYRTWDEPGLLDRQNLNDDELKSILIMNYS